MTKTSLKRNIFFSLRMISNLSLAVLFSLQPSAEAFIGSLQINSSSAQSSMMVQPSEEMSSISDKALLQSALLPIDHKSAEVPALYPAPFSPAVSISTYQNRYRQFARFVFASAGNHEGRRYQAYELNAEGVLGRVIEMGNLIRGEFIRERIYDYKTSTVVLYNPKNIFEKRIYELRVDGEPGRPVQYRGRTSSGDLINIRFFYQSGKVTCVHMKSRTFSSYELSGGVLGNLLEIGTVRSISKEGVPEANHRIAISEIEREGAMLPVYVFHEADGIQITRERIAGNAHVLGAMGRVLRFVSAEADLEYFYEEARQGHAGKVKVLNRLIGESLTFEVTEKDLRENSGRLNAFKDILRIPLTEAVFNSLPLFLKDSSEVLWTPSESKSLPIYIRLNEEVLIWEKLLRGPPAFDRALESLSYSSIFPFDLSSAVSSGFSFIRFLGGAA